MPTADKLTAALQGVREAILVLIRVELDDG